MKDTKHLIQWKEIRNKYQFQLENKILDGIIYDQLTFRLSCLDSLIETEELGV